MPISNRQSSADATRESFDAPTTSARMIHTWQQKKTRQQKSLLSKFDIVHGIFKLAYQLYLSINVEVLILAISILFHTTCSKIFLSEKFG